MTARTRSLSGWQRRRARDYIAGPEESPDRGARLGGKRATATAPAGRIRVVERESRALHGRHVIDGDTTQILGAERIHENLDAAGFENDVVVERPLFDVEAVLEAGTA